MSRRAGLGKEALIYFRSIAIDPVTGRQRLSIPMVCDAPTPAGYVRCEANSTADLEKISREFETQKKSDFARVDDNMLLKMHAKMSEIRSRMNYRLLRTTSSKEKDILRAGLKKLEETEKYLQPRRIEGCLAIESTEAPA